MVKLADGASKPISKIHVGERIRNAKPNSPRPQAHVVEGVIVTTTDSDLIDLTIATPSGPYVITTTSHHLFWIVDAQRWVEASAIVVGSGVQSENGSKLTVTSRRSYHFAIATYDLTVEGVHSYEVLAGHQGVLVHNCPADSDGEGRAQNPQGPGESPIWKNFTPYRSGTKTNGLTGKARRLYEWDYTHNDIEVYNGRGRHLGSMNPLTGEMYKPAVTGRTIPR